MIDVFFYFVFSSMWLVKDKRVSKKIQTNCVTRFNVNVNQVLAKWFISCKILSLSLLRKIRRKKN